MIAARHRVAPLLAGVLLYLSAVGCGTRAHPPTAPMTAAERGRALFVATKCGSCHALRAAGTRGGIGPDLDTSERLDARQLRQSLVEGVNGMPSYAGRLTPAQMSQLTVFLSAATSRAR